MTDICLPAPAFTTRPAGTLVADPAALYGAIKRLHAINDAVVFWNEARTLKLMLRNDPVDPDTVACELALVYDEDDEAMQRVVDLLDGGYVDEPGTFVLDSWSFQAAEFAVEDVTKIAGVINDAYLFTICPCGSYLIRDDAAMCVYCHMTSTAEEKRSFFCTICREDGLAMHMKHQPCCQQRLHSHCLATWRAKSQDERCPLCRQPPGPPAPVPV